MRGYRVEADAAGPGDIMRLPEIPRSIPRRTTDLPGHATMSRDVLEQETRGVEKCRSDGDFFLW